jgi:signal transduction histidine kinase
VKALVPTLWPFDRTFRYIEWIVIGMAALRIWLSSSSFGDAIVKLVPYAILFVFISRIYPVDRPQWLRFIYIVVGLSLVILALWLKLDAENLFYLYIAKACFLLDRYWLLSAIGLGAVNHFLIFSIDLAKVRKACAQTATVDSCNNGLLDYPFLENSFLDYLLTFIPTFCFIWLISRMAISEQQNRQKAEALTQEIEGLAVALERTRIAREIHDALGHTLTNLQMQLTVAQEFKHQDLPLVFESIDSARELTDACIEDVSHAIRTMRQHHFDFNGAVVDLVEKNTQHDLSIHNRVDLPELPLQISHHLYCIIKEGITNIRKHANASLVKLLGWIEDRKIILLIEDNGCGFDPQSVSNGFGLTGIAERVELLGGKLEIQSDPDRGTTLQVTIPQLN